MKTGKFVSGLSNFRIDAIQAHEDLKQHKAATIVAELPEVKKNMRVQDFCFFFSFNLVNLSLG
jgi:hypothetical protein